MNKLRKLMYSIGLPFICIGLILIIVIMVIGMINYGEDWSINNVISLVYITIASILVGACVIGIMMPFVLKSEKSEYLKSIDLSESNIDKDHLPSLFPVVGFDEAIKIQKDGIYFLKTKKLIRYNDLKFSIIHKEFYGQRNNYLKISIDTTKIKNFPSSCYIDFSKELVYLLGQLKVEVLDLDNLKNLKDKSKDTSNVIKTYHYPYIYLVLKIVLSIILLGAGILIIIYKDNNMLAYFLMMISVLIWSNSSKTGKLILTEQGIILKKNFMRIEIPYEEVININITEKNMVISSPFNFIEFAANEDVASEIQKKVSNL